VSGQLWGVVIAAFLASAVEFVEAYTIVLVVGITSGWRSALAGTAAAVATLAVLVGVFGTALVQLIPLNALRTVIGVLLVLFGLRWLKKAILRFAGLTALHDEEAIYERELARLRALGEAPGAGIDGVGVATAFKSVLLEGIEVAFVVITFGAQASSIGAAALGAAGAGVVVVGAGTLLRAPLQRVPENTLKFVVGLMLTGFGTFWGGEGLGITWPGEDAAIPVLIAAYLAVSVLLVSRLRRARVAETTTPVAEPQPTEVMR
jgi:uncharacterized membrane protein